MWGLPCGLSEAGSSPRLQPTGRKRGDRFQHSQRGPERLTLTAADWHVDAELVDGRPSSTPAMA